MARRVLTAVGLVGILGGAGCFGAAPDVPPTPVVPKRPATPMPPRATLQGVLWVAQGGALRRVDVATGLVSGVDACPSSGRALDAHGQAGVLVACDAEGGATLAQVVAGAARPVAPDLRGVSAAAWHPSGSWALVTTSGEAGSALWRVDVTGEVAPWGADVGEVSEAGFAPDGARVAFVRGAGDARDVVVATAAGGGVLTLGGEPGPDVAPRWSPDGQNVAWITTRPEGPRAWVSTADGGRSISLLPPGDGGHSHVRWSPDGTYVAVDEARPGRALVRVVSLKGKRGLRTSHLSDGHAAWSPDARWVAFDRQGPEGTDVFVMEVPEGREVEVLRGASVQLWELRGP